MGHIKEGLLLQWIWGFINKEAEETDQLELLKIHCPSVPTLKDTDSISPVCDLGIWAVSKSSPGEPNAQLVRESTGLEDKQPPKVIQVQGSFLGFELQQLFPFNFIYPF